jgi:UDP-GlcNAc:undecaprenyl-phosphate GlcNAc-1-phosphate transferase
MIVSIFFLIILLLNLFIYYKFNHLTKLANIFDKSDSERKIHVGKVPLFGGIIFIMNLFIFFLFVNFFELKNFFFFDIYFNYSFFFPILLIFFVGLSDDIFQIKAEIKLLLIGIIILLILYFDESLIVNNLYFSSIAYKINLSYYSIPFTVLCFLLFMNALNMFDGINLQVGTYFLTILIFMIFKTDYLLFILTLSIPLATFLLLNARNKSFLGDNGSLILAFIICYLLIKQHNFIKNSLTIEEIFVLMMIPGLDMFRLFLERIFKKKHPFHPDKNHIHHYYLKYYGNIKSYFIVQFFVAIPIMMTIFFHDLYGIFLGLIFYSFFLFQYLSCKK